MAALNHLAHDAVVPGETQHCSIRQKNFLLGVPDRSAGTLALIMKDNDMPDDQDDTKPGKVPMPASGQNSPKLHSDGVSDVDTNGRAGGGESGGGAYPNPHTGKKNAAKAASSMVAKA